MEEMFKRRKWTLITLISGVPTYVADLLSVSIHSSTLHVRQMKKKNMMSYVLS